MSGRGRRVDERIAHTVTFLLRCPGSTVPEAMRACKFSLEESLHPAKQMAVRRSFAKASAGKAVAPPDVIDALTVGTMTVSPLTNQTSVVRGHPSTPSTMPRTPTTTRPKPKPKLIRKSAGGMQKFRINKLATSDHAKRVLKRATRLYAQEKDKPGGLSLRQIEKKLRKNMMASGRTPQQFSAMSTQILQACPR
jgi:hypothetical protein